MTEEITTDIATQNTNVPVARGIEADIEDSLANTYTSIKGETTAEKQAVFNALQHATYSIGDKLNTTIMLKDVIFQKYNKVNDTTGEVEERVRTILFDESGDTYGSASKGLYRTLIQFFKVFGMPDTWSTPMPIQVCEVKMQNGQKTFTIQSGKTD